VRARRALPVALACALTVAGCDSGITGDRGAARKGGTVLVGLAQPPDSLDPALAAAPDALQALWQAYTPPMTYRRAEGAQGTQMVAGLAEAAPESMDDGRTFRFKFRRDLSYSDGRSVRAADFPRAVRRSRALNPQARALLSGIRSIEVNERTRAVRVELTAPDPEFPQLLTTLWTAPVPPGTPTRDLSRTPPVGVGPYRLEGRTRGRSYVLTRVRGFGLANVPAGNVDSVTGTVAASAQRRTSQTLAGRLDVTQGEPPVARLPEIRSEYKARYREFPTLAGEYVAFDLDRPPFTDQDVRQAVAFALDLRALVRLEDGFLAPSCNTIPRQVPGYVKLDPCPYGNREGDSDLVRAEELVRGSRLRRTLVLVDPDATRRDVALARYGVETLRKIGLRARLARTPRERLRATMRFDAITPRRPAPAPYLGVVTDSGVRSEVGALQRDSETPKGARWAALDRQVVQGALIAPFGVRTTGVLLSERLDADRCLRFHPVYGVDFSSLCLS